MNPLLSRDLLTRAADRVGLLRTDGQPAHGAWAAVAEHVDCSRATLSAAWKGVGMSPHVAAELRRFLGDVDVPEATARPGPPQVPCPDPTRLGEPAEDLARAWGVSVYLVARWRREAGVVVRPGRRRRRASRDV